MALGMTAFLRVVIRAMDTNVKLNATVPKQNAITSKREREREINKNFFYLIYYTYILAAVIIRKIPSSDSLKNVIGQTIDTIYFILPQNLSQI